MLLCRFEGRSVSSVALVIAFLWMFDNPGNALTSTTPGTCSYEVFVTNQSGSGFALCDQPPSGFRCACSNETGSSCGLSNLFSSNRTADCSCPVRSLSGRCFDIDECAELSPCASTGGVCTNTDGSYSCSCSQGYTGNGHSCTRVPLCSPMKCPQAIMKCINLPCSYRCACPSGYLAIFNSSTGAVLSCHQVLDCKANEDCAGGSKCHKNVNSLGSVCVDEDECLIGKTCSQNASCVNTIGSYRCSCPPGHTGNGLPSSGCSDIDECRSGAHQCVANSVCLNSVGSYVCTCTPGFTGNALSSCGDVNECKSSMSPCPQRATCKNTNGSYTCPCVSGYRKNGSFCDNINECLESNHTCHGESTKCVDSEGSFNCQCRSGFMHVNFTHCDDVDECLPGGNNDCHSNANCTNFQGTYNCTCQDGYSGNGQVCWNIDECKAMSHNCAPGASAICTDTDGSFVCKCRPGFTGSGQQCDNVNECAQMIGDSPTPPASVANNSQPACDLHAICTDTEGSFNCTCQSGYYGTGQWCQAIPETPSWAAPATGALASFLIICIVAVLVALVMLARAPRPKSKIKSRKMPGSYENHEPVESLAVGKIQATVNEGVRETEIIYGEVVNDEEGNYDVSKVTDVNNHPDDQCAGPFPAPLLETVEATADDHQTLPDKLADGYVYMSKESGSTTEADYEVMNRTAADPRHHTTARSKTGYENARLQKKSASLHFSRSPYIDTAGRSLRRTDDLVARKLSDCASHSCSELSGTEDSRYQAAPIKTLISQSREASIPKPKLVHLPAGRPIPGTIPPPSASFHAAMPVTSRVPNLTSLPGLSKEDCNMPSTSSSLAERYLEESSTRSSNATQNTYSSAPRFDEDCAWHAQVELAQNSQCDTGEANLYINSVPAAASRRGGHLSPQPEEDIEEKPSGFEIISDPSQSRGGGVFELVIPIAKGSS